jgi:uncharacterized lipoprotein
MKYSLRFLTLMIAIFGISACADMPSLIQWHDDEDKPAYAQGSDQSLPGAASRAPLDVPPVLRGEVEVPAPDKIANGNGSLISPAGPDKKLVAGQAVSLDARIYESSAAEVFSAAVDAMTALNMPVQSVDSPSGTLTTDWIRQNSVSANATISAMGSLFGGGVQGVRYRFVVRVLRQKAEASEMTRLEIRTIGQAFINRHWVNRPIQRKVADELFTAVDERLSRQ